MKADSERTVLCFSFPFFFLSKMEGTRTHAIKTKPNRMGQAHPISSTLAPKQDILFLLDMITNSGANTPATLGMCNSSKDGTLLSRESCAGQALQRRIPCKQTQRLTGKAARGTASLELFGDFGISGGNSQLPPLPSPTKKDINFNCADTTTTRKTQHPGCQFPSPSSDFQTYSLPSWSLWPELAAKTDFNLTNHG